MDKKELTQHIQEKETEYRQKYNESNGPSRREGLMLGHFQAYRDIRQLLQTDGD